MSEYSKDITHFYTKAADAWEAMYEDCRRAEHSILCEQYILNDDVQGRKFVAVLSEKAKQGLDTRLILDRVGSRTLIDSMALKDFIASGGRVLLYNPVRWLDLFRFSVWFPRNHNKLMLIDGKVGYHGSACIDATMHDWRDTQIRFTGKLVRMAQNSFLRLWASLTREVYYASTAVNGSNGYPFHYEVSEPHIGVNPIYKNLLKRIAEAQKYVRLVSPYFLPPKRLRKALRAAIRRGVKVEVMIGDKTDVRIADLVTRSYMSRFLKWGIEIHLYKKSVLHTKYAIVDDWGMLGSMNLDYLSLLHNREANIMIDDKEIVQTMSGQFENDLKFCRKASVSDWEDLLWIEKSVGYLARGMKKVL